MGRFGRGRFVQVEQFVMMLSTKYIALLLLLCFLVYFSAENFGLLFFIFISVKMNIETYVIIRYLSVIILIGGSAV